MKTTTLGELDAEMPIGILGDDRKLNKTFKLKPFRLKEERDLGALKEKGGMNLGRYVSNVLAVMCEEVGGKKLEGLTMPQRLLMFSQMYMCDVLYIYTYLRVDALGDELRLKIPCQRCKESFEFRADLKTLDVRTVDDPTEVTHELKLKHGFPLQGLTRKGVTLKPVAWTVFESKSTKDIGALRAAIIQNSICGVEGIDPAKLGPIPEKALDELSKRDVEMIHAAIDDKTPGPVMVVTADCTTCSQTWTAPIDWGYDSFFSHSSL